MASQNSGVSQELAEHQQESRAEWRRLCETLERAQGEELARMCREKFRFIKTYQTYGADQDEIVADLIKSAAQGNYTFFRERGVPREVMNHDFAVQLLADWTSAVAAKKAHVAEIYRLKFQETIDRAIDPMLMSTEEATRLSDAKSLHESDAMLQLSGLGQPQVVIQDVMQLRAEVSELRRRVDELTQLVHSELETLKARIADGS